VLHPQHFIVQWTHVLLYFRVSSVVFLPSKQYTCFTCQT